MTESHVEVGVEEEASVEVKSEETTKVTTEPKVKNSKNAAEVEAHKLMTCGRLHHIADSVGDLPLPNNPDVQSSSSPLESDQDGDSLFSSAFSALCHSVRGGKIGLPIQIHTVEPRSNGPHLTEFCLKQLLFIGPLNLFSYSG